MKKSSSSRYLSGVCSEISDDSAPGHHLISGVIFVRMILWSIFCCCCSDEASDNKNNKVDTVKEPSVKKNFPQIVIQVLLSMKICMFYYLVIQEPTPLTFRKTSEIIVPKNLSDENIVDVEVGEEATEIDIDTTEIIIDTVDGKNNEKVIFSSSL